MALFYFFMVHFVYAIASIHRNYIYVGMTQNIEKRVGQHNSGFEKTTKPYAPFKIIYTEQCADRIAARKREKYWKSGIGKEKLRAIRDNIELSA
jgi:putative endonuclease